MEPSEAEARRLLVIASELEVEQRYAESVQALKKAYKLCPQLEFEDSDDCDPEADHFTRLPEGSGYRTFPAAALDNPAGRGDVRQYFDEYGFVVLEGALAAAEVGEAKARWAEFMNVYGIDVASRESLAQSFADAGKGFAFKGGAGQSTMSWYCRTRPAVMAAFRALLFEEEEEVQKMITSFDGWNFFRNPEVGGADWGGTQQSWFHFDADDRTNCNYVQGILNLVDCTDEHDAGLVLLPRSHRTLFPELIQTEKKEHPQYITYMDAHHKAIYKSLRLDVPFRLPLPAGALVLWKSNVMHCNTGCLPRATPDPTQLIRRLVCYICMQRDPCDPEVTARRQEAFRQGLVSSHHPDLCRTSLMSAPSHEALAAGVVITEKGALPGEGAELL